MTDESTPVLIVGGMVSGLSTAMFLAHQGVDCVVVERRPGTSRHPRIRGISARSVELFRQVGLAPALAEIDDGANEGTKIILAESLAGRELKELVPPHEEAMEGLSPVAEVMCDQDLLEPVLLAKARELGADVRYGWELAGFEQDPEGVTAVVRSATSGAERTVRAACLVACDGAGSPVRERLGIRRAGPGIFGHRTSILFEADLDDLVRGRSIKICLIERVPGAGLLPRHGGRWQFTVPRDPAEGDGRFSEERSVELVRMAVGVADLPVRIRGVEPWEVAGLAAERIQEGRVFLVGDAAHVMPSTGGFGGNVCIQDAHNLAWKLAAVHTGVAGRRLLDTYQAERLPVGQRTMMEAVARTPMFHTARPEGEEPYQPHDAASVMFGYRYRSAAVVDDDGADDDGEVFTDPRVPAGRPGSRAAHLPVDRDGAAISTIDLFGGSFTLLLGPGGGAWRKAAVDVGARFGVGLGIFQMGSQGDLRDITGGFGSAYGVGDRGAVLVRPDGFVAWRSADAPADHVERLDAALRQVLCRDARPG
ncbi:FAD-dependent monooxygenase [Actinomadura fibrosa]|uniref:FAD-dependent monooxygenase n=1 Tax=Actinomadura fibrosa TaxID=111802 RepID=A0ABW2Y3S2_9ACTN|nr:FAD-dependent monooxygenase [Actinomadura fibrosa]